MAENLSREPPDRRVDFPLVLLGSTGFVGKSIKKLAGEENREVFTFSTRGTNLYDLELFLRELVERADIGQAVCVVAAAAGVSEGVRTTAEYEFNASAIPEIIRLIRNSGVQKFLVLGSCFEYGTTGNLLERLEPDSPLNPAEPYGVSKAEGFQKIADWVASEPAVDLTYLRLFQVFGPSESLPRLYPALRLAAEKGDDFVVNNPTLVRDFCDLERVAKTILLATRELSGFVTDNVSTGIPQSVGAFAAYLWARHGAVGELVLDGTGTPGPYLRLVGTEGRLAE